MVAALIVSCATVAAPAVSGVLTPRPPAAAPPASSGSACAGDGPFAPIVDDPALRRAIVERAVEPAFFMTPGRRPKKEVAVCQDPLTGETKVENLSKFEPKVSFPVSDRSSGGDDGVGMMALETEDEQNIIIGGDQRVIQSPATAFPFRAVADLIIRFPNTPAGMALGCTGNFIGGRHILTAGHCVYDEDRGGWAVSMSVVPGRDGNSPPPFGVGFMVARRSVTCWTNDEDRDCDYAVVTLDRTFNVGSFGLLYLSDDDLDSTTAYLIGYPGDLGTPAGQQQAHVPAGGPITDYFSKHIFHNMDTFNGQSGAGIYRFWNGKRAIIGVHAGGYDSNENSGPRITKARHDLIRSWQQQDQ